MLKSTGLYKYRALSNHGGEFSLYALGLLCVQCGMRARHLQSFAVDGVGGSKLRRCRQRTNVKCPLLRPASSRRACRSLCRLAPGTVGICSDTLTAWHSFVWWLLALPRWSRRMRGGDRADAAGEGTHDGLCCRNRAVGQPLGSPGSIYFALIRNTHNSKKAKSVSLRRPIQ